MWGLAFKPKTDDMREAPSIEVIEGLLGKGAQVVAHDPGGATHVRAARTSATASATPRRPTRRWRARTALFVVTEWNEFRHPDFERMKALMKTPVIFDGRNVFDPTRMRELGFTYFGIGRR